MPSGNDILGAVFGGLGQAGSNYLGQLQNEKKRQENFIDTADMYKYQNDLQEQYKQRERDRILNSSDEATSLINNMLGVQNTQQPNPLKPMSQNPQSEGVGNLLGSNQNESQLYSLPINGKEVLYNSNAPTIQGALEEYQKNQKSLQSNKTNKLIDNNSSNEYKIKDLAKLQAIDKVNGTNYSSIYSGIIKQQQVEKDKSIAEGLFNVPIEDFSKSENQKLLSSITDPSIKEDFVKQYKMIHPESTTKDYSIKRISGSNAIEEVTKSFNPISNTWGKIEKTIKPYKTDKNLMGGNGSKGGNLTNEFSSDYYKSMNKTANDVNTVNKQKLAGMKFYDPIKKTYTKGNPVYNQDTQTWEYKKSKDTDIPIDNMVRNSSAQLNQVDILLKSPEHREALNWFSKVQKSLNDKSENNPAAIFQMVIKDQTSKKPTLNKADVDLIRWKLFKDYPENVDASMLENMVKEKIGTTTVDTPGED